MKKSSDFNWVEEQKRAAPPTRYALSLKEAILLMTMESPFYQVVAAYNYGFKRGRTYERKKGPMIHTQKSRYAVVYLLFD